MKRLWSTIQQIIDILYFTFYAKGIDQIDSPYLVRFFQEVIASNTAPERKSYIESVRRKYIISKSSPIKRQFGAGSKSIYAYPYTLRNISLTSVSSPFKCQRLYRVACFLESKNILELGSSLGISAAYLGSASHCQNLISVDANEELIHLARDHFQKDPIKFVCQTFEETLVGYIHNQQVFDLIYLDGDHSYGPTMRHFNLCKEILSEKGVLIIDDIYWSSEMKQCWDLCRKDDSFQIKIDMFYFGI